MLAIFCRSDFESCIESRAHTYINHARSWFGRVSEAFRTGYHIANIGRESVRLQGGDSRTFEKWTAVADACDTARSLNDSFRVVFPVYNLFFGNMFVEKKKGEKGIFVRDWMEIAMGVLELGARLLTPIRLGHQLKIYDLGVHASRLSGATMGLWGAILTINWIQSVIKLVEADEKEVAQKILDIGQSTLDQIALVFDFGACANLPALSIAGSALNVAAVVFGVFQDVIKIKD